MSSAWRANRMNTYAKLIAAAAVVLLVAVVGVLFLPGSGGGAQPTSAPASSPTLLARGSFGAKGGEVELDATGAGDSVTGTMTVAHETGDFSVDLKCTRTADDGRILIAGDTTDSTSGYASKGARTAIVLKPGSPVHSSFDFEVEGRPAASCMAFLEAVMGRTSSTDIGPDALEPIEGTIELGP